MTHLNLAEKNWKSLVVRCEGLSATRIRVMFSKARDSWSNPKHRAKKFVGMIVGYEVGLEELGWESGC